MPRSATNFARRVALLAGCGLLAYAGASAQPQAQSQALPMLRLQIGDRRALVEVARTRAQRETGLMHRRALPSDQGMLFVFRRERDVCMWMKNTYVPLSVAFIADDGRVRAIAAMQPLTLDAHCAGQPVRYALEMPQGWFAAHGVHRGSVVGGLPAAAAAPD